MCKKRIGVLFGGRSEEHEVSLISASSVIRALDSEKFVPIYIGITRRGNGKNTMDRPKKSKMVRGKKPQRIWSWDS